MPKNYTPPQAFETTPRPLIPLYRVASKQIAAIGYDTASSTLALQFRSKDGVSAPVYHYTLDAEKYTAFRASSSLGGHFGVHIKPLAFKRYPAEPFPPVDEE